MNTSRSPLFISAMAAIPIKALLSSVVILAADDISATPVEAQITQSIPSEDGICPPEKNFITVSRCRKGLMMTCERRDPHIYCDVDGYPLHSKTVETTNELDAPVKPTVAIKTATVVKVVRIYHEEQHVQVRSTNHARYRSKPRDLSSFLQSLFHPRGH